MSRSQACAAFCCTERVTTSTTLPVANSYKYWPCGTHAAEEIRNCEVSARYISRDVQRAGLNRSSKSLALDEMKVEIQRQWPRRWRRYRVSS
jgi:hypothetical protein